MTDYITTTAFKADYPNSEFGFFSDEYDPAINALITTASRLVDREVGKWENYFSPSSDAEVRYFDGNGQYELYIDDAVSVSALAVSEEGGLASSDYSTWSSSDYITHPYNQSPIYKIIVDRLNGSKLYFDPYYKAVKVTGIFGYSATPPDLVVQAVKIQVARWLMRQKQLWQDVNQQELGAVVVNVNSKNFVGSKLDPDVAAMLQPYKVAAMGDE